MKGKVTYQDFEGGFGGLSVRTAASICRWTACHPMHVLTESKSPSSSLPLAALHS